MEKDILTLADYIVSTIQYLYLNEARNKGAAFAVSLRIDFDDHHSDEEKPSVIRFLHIAVVGERAYKKVYAAMTDRPMGFQSVPWQYVCSHDSAWREDGVRDSVKRWYRAAVESATATFNLPTKDLSRHILVEKMKIAPYDEVFEGGKLPDLPLQQFSSVLA